MISETHVLNTIGSDDPPPIMINKTSFRLMWIKLSPKLKLKMKLFLHKTEINYTSNTFTDYFLLGVTEAWNRTGVFISSHLSNNRFQEVSHSRLEHRGHWDEEVDAENGWMAVTHPCLFCQLWQYTNYTVNKWLACSSACPLRVNVWRVEGWEEGRTRLAV